MLYTNRTHLLDLLVANTASLIVGGAAFNTPPAGAPMGATWMGVKRPNNGVDVATAGWVNVFDESYVKAGSEHRPAIYLGGPGLPIIDDLEQRGIAAVPIEWRVLWIPLVIVAQAPTLYVAERMRDQLRSNVRSILMLRTTFAQAGFWYELTVPGRKGGGGAAERSFASDTGAGSSGGTLPPGIMPRGLGVAEAQAVVPVKIRYSYRATSPA